MQATVGTTRFNLRRLKVMAVGLGILLSAVIVTVSVIAVTASDEASRPVVRTVPSASEPGSYTFQEQNLFLPEGDARVRPATHVQSASETVFIEQNTILPGAITRSVTLDDMRFIEDNLSLPGWTARSVAPDFRLLDMNVLPGDDTQHLLPHADWPGESY